MGAGGAAALGAMVALGALGAVGALAAAVGSVASCFSLRVIERVVRRAGWALLSDILAEKMMVREKERANLISRLYMFSTIRIWTTMVGRDAGQEARGEPSIGRIGTNRT